jgi:hypothetical protein
MLRIIPILLLFTLFFAACVRTRAVYIEKDKATAQSAIQLFIIRFNREDFEVIYDNADEIFKNANSKEAVVPMMKQTREENGKILEVTDKQVNFFQNPPMRVKAIYNLKCEKGERSMWFTYLLKIDGKASLAEIQTFNGYSDISKYKNEESK